jgi:signal transduction histidine kinase
MLRSVPAFPRVCAGAGLIATNTRGPGGPCGSSVIQVAERHALELRPKVLDELGVGAAVEALADQAEKPAVEVRTRIELGFEKGRIALRHDADLEAAVYGIVQEALANAMRHAGPSRVALEVVEDDESGAMKITVRDNGGGFDPSAAVDGFGLRGMRERAELRGGSLEIRSVPGGGTEVRAAIPVVRRQAGVGPVQST